MRRIEGFIDINRMLKKGELKKLEDYTDFSFIPNNMSVFIDTNNEIYFFKHLLVGNPYSELLAEELLKDFQLPHAEYDLAIYNKEKGVITKNFRKKDKKYISGEEILKDYLNSLNLDNKEYDLGYYNNLETFWNAIEYRYKKHPNKDIIIEKLMNQLVNLFIFDILVENFDRYCKNYQIEEGKDDINLAPIYDNESIALYLRSVSLGLEDGDSFLNYYESLKKFIDVSDFKSNEIIKGKLWIISGENIDDALYRIERKTGYPVPDGIVVEYIKEFISHKEKIEKILDNNTKGDIYER